MGSLNFKIATEPEEFEQVHRLNYLTFVEEIPQHERNSEGRLVDKFHTENTYFIALDAGQVVGMICARDRRPFSLDIKLENLDSYLPPHTSICELRLLAVAKTHRRPHVFRGLMRAVASYCEQKGYDLVIGSGTTRQAKLYRHLGFTPFGPLVGNGNTLFQPMSVTSEAFKNWKTTTKLLTD